MKIDRPSLPAEHPNRLIACQEAMESAVIDLVASATATGWTRVEALGALGDLADNLMLAHRSVEETERVMAMIKRMT